MPQFAAPSYIATPTHEAAIGQVLRALDAGATRVRLVGEPGVGKSTILRQVLARLRGPWRRVALADSSCGTAALLDALAVALGGAPAGSGIPAWQRLVECVRLLDLQRQRAVFAIDDADRLDEPSALERLAGLAARPGVTLLETARDGRSDSGRARILAVDPLTRGDAGLYLARWLAGRGLSTRFTARATTRIHGLARGIPRRINGLATLASELAAENRTGLVRAASVEEVAVRTGDL
jgi:type II secretory pathway predicted ATPase ExeA